MHSKPKYDPAKLLNPESRVIKQLGLDTPQGLTRLLLALIAKYDPDGHGITITPADIMKTVEIAVNQRRQNIMVHGRGENIILMLKTDEDAQETIEKDTKDGN